MSALPLPGEPVPVPVILADDPDVIELTHEWTRSDAARAVPGAEFDGRRWTLPEPDARSAIVALKLFPELMHQYPELVELRDSIIINAKPVDYATQCDIRIRAPRVRERMWNAPYPEGHEKAGQPRRWKLEEAQVEPVDAGKDFQEIDLGFVAAVLQQNGAAGLGWSRGFGKTIGAAAIMDELDTRANLVIAPNSSKATTWADELAWVAPWLNVLVLPNDAKKREGMLMEAKRCFIEGEPFVLIVHYESLALIAGKKTHRKNRNTGKLVKLKHPELQGGWKRLGIQWDLFVGDEGHRFANPDTLQSRAGLRARRMSRMCLLETGSVFQNRWEEMFGLLKIQYPDRYRSAWRDWNNRFIDYVENGYGKIAVGLLEGQLDKMRDELGRFWVVRDKVSKVKRTEVKVPLSPEQRRIYEEMVTTTFAELPDGQRLKAGVGVALLTRLRQIATGLDCFNPEVLHDSTKIDTAVDIIERDIGRGDDFVVFGWYKASLEALREQLKQRGIEAFLIDGDVPQKKRTEIIRAFQGGAGRVLLGTIATMGESVNLQRANHVVRLDRSFNPAANQQSVDRLDRQGQTREVYLDDIIADETVDDLVVMPNLANKEALRAIVLGAQKENLNVDR